MTAILISLLCLVFIIFSVGSLAALFLHLMTMAIQYFSSHGEMVLLLPVLGVVTALCYSIFGRGLPNTKSILHRVHEKTPLIPFITGIFIFVFTILSQIFGASTGRESTAVQFGAAFAEFWKGVFDRTGKFIWSRQLVIRCGMAAGFGAVFGVPWAGAIFAVESSPNRRWPFRYIPACLASSFGAFWVSLWWGATHKHYPAFTALHWDFNLVAKWTVLGVAFGLFAKIFVTILSFLEKKIFGSLPWNWLRALLGGLILAALSFYHKDHRYNGLGLQIIDSAFNNTLQTWDFAWKSLYTLLSVTSGFKGGEVTPLMAIGASLGGIIAGYISLPVVYASSLGLISVFAASAHIPWTGAVMAWEFFGFEAFLPTFIICWIARRVLGLSGLFVEKE